jgi:5-methyltetrahydrofolate--homocysteine methyltransferase
MSNNQALVDAIVDMREDDALQMTQISLDEGQDPLAILDDCREAMDIIGNRFEEGIYYIPELIMAGEILNQITEIVKPRLVTNAETEKLGKIVFGTVEGDIHDIAKDIVAFMLDINGFEVTDLGVDVPPANFVDTVQETGATIVGLSGFLTLAYEPMKETVNALKAAGLDDVKIMIGGGQIDEQIREYTGADAFGKDAMTAVSLAKQWVGVN